MNVCSWLLASKPEAGTKSPSFYSTTVLPCSFRLLLGASEEAVCLYSVKFHRTSLMENIDLMVRVNFEKLCNIPLAFRMLT